ncbi:MAG TPA: MFS transporter [Clostridiaceae bacterium]|nr:MFS transporter [Clostridiaceae bacterium]
MRRIIFDRGIAKIRSLNKNFRAFLKMNSCFLGFVTIINLFINTFLFKASGNSDQVMIYNIFLSAVQPFSMIGTVFVLRKASPLISQRISFLLYGIVFASLVITGEYAANYYWAIGTLLSIAAGFYYATYCLQLVSYTNDDNLDTATGILSTVGSVISLALPLILGFLLSLFKDFTGYRILFILMFMLSSLALKFSMELAPLSQFDKDKKVYLSEVAQTLLQNKIGWKIMGITFLIGIRDGTFSFFISVLIYQFIANEAVIGINSFLGNACAILSASLYALLVTPGRRSRSVFFSVTVIAGAIALLYINLSPVTLIAFNVVNSLLIYFINMPQVNIYFSVVQNIDYFKGKGAEVHTIREFFLGAGKVLGIILTMNMPGSAAGYVTAMLILTVSQYISAFLINSIQSQLDIQQTDNNKTGDELKIYA